MYFLSRNGEQLGHTLSRADALAAARDFVTADPLHTTARMATDQGNGPLGEDDGEVIATFQAAVFCGTRWTGGPAPGRPGPDWLPQIDPPDLPIPPIVVPGVGRNR